MFSSDGRGGLDEDVFDVHVAAKMETQRGGHGKGRGEGHDICRYAASVRLRADVDADAFVRAALVEVRKEVMAEVVASAAKRGFERLRHAAALFCRGHCFSVTGEVECCWTVMLSFHIATSQFRRPLRW